MRILIMILISAVVFSCNTKEIETNDNYDFVELPDGSSVYLNKHSSLNYNASFDDRNIELEGEAYFEVTEGDMPFIISVPHGRVTILGTELNVNTKNDALEVEVAEGEVEVDTDEGKKVVKKGERAIKKAGNKLELKKATRSFDRWLRDLDREMKKAGHVLRKKSKEAGKEIKKESKKAEKELKKIFK